MAKAAKKALVIDQTTDKKAQIASLVEQINKARGDGTIMYGTPIVDCEIISTGALTLDVALGVGGLPRGRIVEIYGPESSGKTTLALTVAANAQKVGGTVAYIDAEHALDPGYAAKIGVDISQVLLSQPSCGEEALETASTLVDSGIVDVIVVDSVAALVPKAELDGNMGDSHVGLHARLMSQALRKLTAQVAKANCIVIFINQLREKIGVMFGSPETTTGGRALKFYSSVRLDIRRIASLKEEGAASGNRTRVKVVKNKVAPPFKEAEFDIMFAKGINRAGCVADLGDELKILDKRGSFYSYKGERLANGRNALCTFLDENPDLLAELEAEVLDKVLSKPESTPKSPSTSEDTDGLIEDFDQEA